MRSYEDAALRQALHSIYLALFGALKTCPDGFTKADATRMLTGLMAARPWSWRVVGITRAALDLLAQHNFRRPPRQLQRGHLVDRSTTAHLLFDRKEPASLQEFFDVYLDRDKTVIMTNAENTYRRGSQLPKYIDIDPDLELFPSGTLVGWQHRNKEIEFLRKLHARLQPPNRVTTD
jgi:hypothetical protein